MSPFHKRRLAQDVQLAIMAALSTGVVTLLVVWSVDVIFPAFRL